MAQEKTPARSGTEATTNGPETPKTADHERTAPIGKPLVSLSGARADDTVRPAEPVVSYGQTEPFPPLPSLFQDRETLPPPVPMEQLVEQMMKPEVDTPRLLGADDLARASKMSSAETLPPPASDVDTVRPRGDDAKTIPPTGDEPLEMGSSEAKTLPPAADDELRYARNEADTLPPPGGSDADTTPPGPAEIIGQNEALYRSMVAQDAAKNVTAQALDMAEAVFEEIGVKLGGRAPSREGARDSSPEEAPRTRPPEEVPRSRTVEEAPRTRPPEELPRSRTPEEVPRSRLTPSARLTPPRTMRPVLDAPPPPPSAVSSRQGTSRRKPSEPGVRSTADVLIPQDRVTPSPSSAPMTERLNEVRERYDAQDYRAALTLAESILATYPDHIAALGYAESSRQLLRQKLLLRLGDTSRVCRLRASAQELAKFVQDERSARLVKAMDGTRSIDDIVLGSGIPTIDALTLIHDLVVAGLLELGVDSWGRR